MNTCMVTGKKAKYKDPLTLTPFANKDAFKVVRERFFQKEEDRLNMRIHIINELLNQKRAKLKRFKNAEMGYEMYQDPNTQQQMSQPQGSSQNITQPQQQVGLQDQPGEVPESHQQQQQQVENEAEPEPQIDQVMQDLENGGDGTRVLNGPTTGNDNQDDGEIGEQTT